MCLRVGFSFLLTVLTLYLFVLSASRTKQSLDNHKDSYPTINICTLDAQRDDEELNGLVRDNDIVVRYFYCIN